MQQASQVIRNEIAKLEAHKATVQGRIDELHAALLLIEGPNASNDKRSDGMSVGRALIGTLKLPAHSQNKQPDHTDQGDIDPRD